MYHLIYILIIISLGIWVGFLLRKMKELKAKGKSTEAGREDIEQVGWALAEHNQAARAKIEESKNRIMTLLQDKGRITNDEAQKELGVSDATTTRYLDELEKDNKIIQQGSQKGTFYVLK
ncbi:winged helix-turn-helix domain-containing protein [Patescibacteria group bacterium]|nr:winged helix-turn-helix domain-containing protein [Patescibacteria group bacterium]MBU2265119.1 winged helix-turn-helix domain-containing protein [Patescibacteria group bacterium]